MQKKLTKEERIKEKEKLSNVITTKMAIAFSALVIGIILIVRFGERTVPSLATLIGLQIAFGLLTAGAVAWYVVKSKAKTDFRMDVLSAPFVLGLFASAFFAVLAYPTFGALRVILSLIAFALLFFVFEIYAPDFFICSIAMVTSCIAASVINSAGFAGYIVIANVAAVILSVAISAACAFVIFKTNKDGKFKVLGKVLRKPQGGTHFLVYAGIAVGILSVLASLILGYTIYCVAITCAMYAAIAIIYTVKLM